VCRQADSGADGGRRYRPGQRVFRAGLPLSCGGVRQVQRSSVRRRRVRRRGHGVRRVRLVRLARRRPRAAGSIHDTTRYDTRCYFNVRSKAGT